LRKLASIQVIESINPIANADSLEVCKVLGWDVVVKKGEYWIGDMIVFIETDSILPDRPEFKFMRSRYFKVKTIKLRGQISQGLIMPIQILTKGACYIVGQDVTEELGITKFEPDEYNKPTNKEKVKSFQLPSWCPNWLHKIINKVFGKKKKKSIWDVIPKTDETRVQNLQGLLNKTNGQECYITEKLDGSSITVYLYNGKFGVCSRNIDLPKQESGNQFWNAVIASDIEEKMRHFYVGGNNIALQGELIGTGIQENKYKLADKQIKFFGVWDIDKQEYLSFDRFMRTMVYLDLSTVPILGYNEEIHSNIPLWVDTATRKSVINPDVLAEGIVVRTLDSKNSFKAINPQFLLKYNL